MKWGNVALMLDLNLSSHKMEHSAQLVLASFLTSLQNFGSSTKLSSQYDKGFTGESPERNATCSMLIPMASGFRWVPFDVVESGFDLIRAGSWTMKIKSRGVGVWLIPPTDFPLKCESTILVPFTRG